MDGTILIHRYQKFDNFELELKKKFNIKKWSSTSINVQVWVIVKFFQKYEKELVKCWHSNVLILDVIDCDKMTSKMLVDKIDLLSKKELKINLIQNSP